MGQEVLQKFDRYFLLDCLAQGGMAEIFRARPASTDSTGRLVVIKRVLANHARNPEFIQMFRSETKVMMGFTHPNVIQLFDFGEARGQPYIAMEYVDGKNLRQFLSKLNERKESMLIQIATYVIEQAAAGLYYAHQYKDKITGDHLGIVHRDVSPQNILISYDGNIKLIDFGIAKASTNSEATRVGVIKGKPSYLSPEQVSAKELDGRSDIFSLGAVLWEILTGRKLFAPQNGENEFAVLKLIEAAETTVKPPSQVNKEVPEELDMIVLKSLAKDREKRFQTAEEMQLALRRFLNKNYPEFSPSQLSDSFKVIFKDSIVEDRKRIQHLNGKAEQLLREEIKDQTDPFKKVQHKIEITQNKTPHPGPVSSSVAESRNITVEDSSTAPKVVQITKPIRPAHHAVSTPVVRSVNKMSEATFESSGDYFDPRLVPEKDPIPARLGPKVDLPKRRRFSMQTMIFMAFVGVLVVFGPELYANYKKRHASRAPANVPPVPLVKASAEAKSVPKFRLMLNIPPGFTPAKIELNGRNVPEENPLVEVPIDTTLILRVKRDGFKDFEREFSVNSQQIGGRSEWVMDVPLEPLNFGTLSVVSTPSAQVTLTKIDDPTPTRAITLQTPIRNIRIPVGKYKIELKNELLGMEKTLIKSVESHGSVKIEERLEASQLRAPAAGNQ